ncbi:MAG TPA: tetratricopeptide repeat protein [Vicinamibacteria bacterium]|nr:tetratricopeptide repeat protein [Vicinamibacteria bacterium]
MLVVSRFMLVVLATSLKEPVELRPVPEPRLAELEDAVREQIGPVHDLLDELASEQPDSLSARELADAFGSGGQIYFTYDLPEPAEASFENARLLAPTDYRWPYYLGALHQKAGRLEEAVAFYREVLLLRSHDVPALVHLAEALQQLNRLDEAEALYRKGLAADGSCIAARAGLGQIAFLRRDYSLAVDLFQESLAAVPDASRLHYPLAMAYRQLGEEEKARQHLERSGPVGVGVRDPLMDELLELRRGERVHTLRGKVAFRFGRYEDAASEFAKAVEASPESFRARVNLGSALAAVGNVDAALREYEAALGLEPLSANAHYNLGYLLARRGDSEAATRHLRAAIEADPEDHEAHVELADVLHRAGLFADAERHYSKAAALAPDDGRALLGRSRALAADGRYREALAGLEDAHGKLPTDGGIAQALARLLASSPDAAIRDGARSLGLAQRVFDARPTPFHAETVAMALAELGRCEEASRWLRVGIELASREPRTDSLDRLKTSLSEYESGPPCRPPSRDP